MVHYFVDKYNKKIGRKITTIPKTTLNIFQNYSWPGNVRELESVIERAIITSSGTTLQVTDYFDIGCELEAELQIKKLADLECDHIIHVLRKTGWRVEGEKGAAVVLGLNPSTLRARMRKYGLRRPD